MKKCLSPIDAHLVSCPTCMKNLEWYLGDVRCSTINKATQCVEILSEGASIDCVYACLFFVCFSGSIYRKVNESTFNVKVVKSIPTVVFKILFFSVFIAFKQAMKTLKIGKKWSAIFPIFGYDGW